MKITFNLADICQFLDSEHTALLDGLEWFLEDYEFEVRVGVNIEKQTRHHPGCKEMYLRGGSEAIQPTHTCPIDYVPEPIEETITAIVESQEPPMPELFEQAEEWEEAV